MKIVDRWLARRVIRIENEIRRYEDIEITKALPEISALVKAAVDARDCSQSNEEENARQISGAGLVPLTLAKHDDPNEPVTLSVYEGDRCCSIDLSPSTREWLSKELHQS